MVARTFSLTLAAAVLTATPLTAQTPAELVGSYPMTVSTVGSDCPRDGRTTFKVVSITGEELVFRLDGKEASADYHSSSLSFRKELHGPGDPRAINGQFTRGPETVGLEIDWNSGACQIHMEGERAAPLLAGMPPSDGDSAEASSPRIDPRLRDLGYYGLLFGIGAGIVFLFHLGRKRR